MRPRPTQTPPPKGTSYGSGTITVHPPAKVPISPEKRINWAMQKVAVVVQDLSLAFRKKQQDMIQHEVMDTFVDALDGSWMPYIRRPVLLNCFASVEANGTPELLTSDQLANELRTAAPGCYELYGRAAYEMEWRKLSYYYSRERTFVTFKDLPTDGHVGRLAKHFYGKSPRVLIFYSIVFNPCETRKKWLTMRTLARPRRYESYQHFIRLLRERNPALADEVIHTLDGRNSPGRHSQSSVDSPRSSMSSVPLSSSDDDDGPNMFVEPDPPPPPEVTVLVERYVRKDPSQ